MSWGNTEHKQVVETGVGFGKSMDDVFTARSGEHLSIDKVALKQIADAKLQEGRLYYHCLGEGMII